MGRPKKEETPALTKTQMQTKAANEARRKIKSADELQQKVDAYFAECERSGEIPNEFALAGKLGVAHDTLRDWKSGDRSKDLQEVTKSAYDRMAALYFQLLRTGDKNMSAPVIFFLKQPVFGGYQDRVESRNDTTVRVVFGKGVNEDDFK